MVLFESDCAALLPGVTICGCVSCHHTSGVPPVCMASWFKLMVLFDGFILQSGKGWKTSPQWTSCTTTTWTCWPIRCSAHTARPVAACSSSCSKHSPCSTPSTRNSSPSSTTSGLKRRLVRGSVSHGFNFETHDVKV